MTRSQERRKLNERYLLLKEWYGKEYAKTEMAAHTCQPTDINLIIQHECECLAAPEVGVFITLESRWREIVGEQLAVYAKPARLRDGVLSLEVRHSSLIRELAPSLDLIQKRIDELLGPGVCSSIKLIPSGSLSRGKRA